LCTTGGGTGFGKGVALPWTWANPIVTRRPWPVPPPRGDPLNWTIAEKLDKESISTGMALPVLPCALAIPGGGGKGAGRKAPKILIVGSPPEIPLKIRDSSPAAVPTPGRVLENTISPPSETVTGAFL